MLSPVVSGCLRLCQLANLLLQLLHLHRRNKIRKLVKDLQFGDGLKIQISSKKRLEQDR